MTTKKKQLIILVIASVLATVGLVCMIIASVFAFKSTEDSFSHTIEIKNIETQPTTENGTVYHIVTIEGDLFNNTDKSYETINLEITFNGVDNKSGQQAEYLTGIVIEEFYANTKKDINEKQLTIGNQRGFIPESIKSINVVLANERVAVAFEKTNEGSLALFGSALILIFVSGLVFAKWSNNRKKEIVNGNK